MNGPLMIVARDLHIEHSENAQYWNWVHDPEYTEVAELRKVWWLDIKASIKFSTLSANTTYGAYLLFKTKPNSRGLHIHQEASVSVGGQLGNRFVCLKPTNAMPPNIGLPVESRDGWMEIELGQFECDNVTAEKEAMISIMEINTHNEKTGLIVAGIELRPI